MHRVELKVTPINQLDSQIDVPNAPCGVESSDYRGCPYEVDIVPNAPCGVESWKCDEYYLGFLHGFLMHRVELKAVIVHHSPKPLPAMFLMHRVELKAISKVLVLSLPTRVPNAPCGVESGRAGVCSSA